MDLKNCIFRTFLIGFKGPRPKKSCFLTKIYPMNMFLGHFLLKKIQFFYLPKILYGCFPHMPLLAFFKIFFAMLGIFDQKRLLWSLKMTFLTLVWAPDFFRQWATWGCGYPNHHFVLKMSFTLLFWKIFFLYRNTEDFISWTDNSAIRRQLLEYQDMVIDIFFWIIYFFD